MPFSKSKSSSANERPCGCGKRGARISLEIIADKDEKKATHLRHPVVGVHHTPEGDPAPEEARKVLPVPEAGVEHVRREHGADDADDVA